MHLKCTWSLLGWGRIYCNGSKSAMFQDSAESFVPWEEACSYVWYICELFLVYRDSYRSSNLFSSILEHWLDVWSYWFQNKSHVNFILPKVWQIQNLVEIPIDTNFSLLPLLSRRPCFFYWQKDLSRVCQFVSNKSEVDTVGEWRHRIRHRAEFSVTSSSSFSSQIQF